MARANGISQSGSAKYRPSSKKANAAGYAKRRSQKAKADTLGLDDVYEYAPMKVRRSKVSADLDREELAEWNLGQRSDDAEQDEDARGELKARLIGENADNEQIDSGDDEDIDSDAAFEESDKEQFAGFDFSRHRRKAVSRKRKSRQPRKQQHEVDLNENDDELLFGRKSVPSSGSDEESASDDKDEEDEPGEFFDVLDVFDGRANLEEESGEALREKAKEGRQAESRSEADDDDEGPADGAEEEEEKEEEDDDGEDDDDEEEGDEERFDFSPSDEEVAPEALNELENFISTLDPEDVKKRKAGDTDPLSTDGDRSKKRRMIKERNEAGPEGVFSTNIRGSQKLQLDDLLAPLATSSDAVRALKKSAKLLTSTSSKIPKTLSAPLPQRTQERLDREAAYEQTREEVEKWGTTIKRIKEAEHLSFPLQVEPEGRVSNLELAARFKPSTELESSVDKLLKAAQMRDEDITQTEELKMAHLSVEEVARRRDELRAMRELAFRAELKAKRVAKIKSKTYRRIRKKQREKLDAHNQAVGDEEEYESARLQAEVARARERATLRHKNTGKWARAMQGKEGLDVDQRREIAEMLERGEKLRRKIKGDDSEEGSDDEEDDEDWEGKDVEEIKKDAFNELQEVNGQDTEARISEGKGKSVFEMKFMRDAAARRGREVHAMADDFAKELGLQNQNGSDAETENDISPSGDGQAIQRMGGRVVFQPAVSNEATNERPIVALPSDVSSVTIGSSDFIQGSPPLPSPSTSAPPRTAISASPLDIEESNPWLTASVDTHVHRKKNEVLVHKDSSALAKGKNKLKKQSARNEEERERIQDDATLEIDTSKVMTMEQPNVSDAADVPPTSSSNSAKRKQGKSKAKKKKLQGSEAPAQDNDSDAHSEFEEQERALMQSNKAKNTTAFEQRELVAMAFAGDNVVQAFEDAKQREIEADAPREVDTTLPGWGSWGGTGTQRKPPQPHLIKKLPGIDPSTRADYKKAHVIISEKRDKKAAKYLVKDLPYPYTSHKQFEGAMETPLGAEWNTRVAFQRGTLPRVVKKMGTVITPLEKLF